MKYIKTFENNIDLKNKNIHFLCAKEPDESFYWKFTNGEKYKLYISNRFGLRLKDDKNEFWHAPINERRLIENIKNDNIYTFKCLDGIFTTAKSIEDYEVDIESKKYNL